MRGAACIGMLVVISVLSVVGSNCQESTGTPTAESITAHLTGGGQRVWVITLFRIRLAQGIQQCVSGEEWTFGHDGKGIKRTCENGAPREQKFTWRWVGIRGDRPVLKIDEEQYLAAPRQQKAEVEGDPPVLVTALRMLRTRQDVLGEEIILRFQDR